MYGCVSHILPMAGGPRWDEKDNFMYFSEEKLNRRQTSQALRTNNYVLHETALVFPERLKVELLHKSHAATCDKISNTFSSPKKHFE